MTKSPLLQSMGLMAAMAETINFITNRMPTKPQVVYRNNSKKCKTCSMFPCKPYQSNKELACVKYTKKKK